MEVELDHGLTKGLFKNTILQERISIGLNKQRNQLYKAAYKEGVVKKQNKHEGEQGSSHIYADK